MDRSQRLGSAGGGWRSPRGGSPAPRGGSPAPSPRGEFRRDSAGLGDSKGGQGISATIQLLAHEQERVQKKTFTNWINSYLIKHIPPLKVESLFEDIKDGKILLALLETLSGEKLPGEKGAKLKRVHYVSNISNALRFLESKKIKLVNINPSDIADGKPAIVLGLVWTIILYFQIEETATRMAEQAAVGTPSKKMSPLEKFRVSAKKALMQWTEQSIAKRYGLNVTDFGKSWRDGVAFNAIIDNISPGLVDMDKVRQQTPKVNLENAFSTAESHLGIARLIDPEDVDVDKPDEKSIMTYVAQFMKAYPDSAEDPANRKTPTKTLSPSEQEQKRYDDLMAWLQQAEGTLQIVKEPITDLQKEYMDYVNFKKEYDAKAEEFRKLGQLIESRQALALNDGNWRTLQSHFLPVSDNTSKWLTKLDHNLPGKLGQLGVWLTDAQQLIGQGIMTNDDPETMTAQLTQMLNSLNEFFKDADAYKRLLAEVKRTGKYQGQPVSTAHIEDLQKRFTEIQSEAGNRERKLVYELSYSKIYGLLDVAEEKLQSWKDPYGHEDQVLERLNDYKDFVVEKRLVQTFDKMYSDLKSKADIYKKDNAGDKQLVLSVEKRLQGISERWRPISSQVRSVQPMLEEGVASWKRFNASVDWLDKWIGDGEIVLEKSNQEKEAFFKDVKPAQDKLKVMRESGKRLSEHTEPAVNEEIQDTVEQITLRYDELLNNMKHAHQVEVVEKGRSEYLSGIERLKTWVGQTEDTMNKPVPCTTGDLKDYLALVEDINGEISQIEAAFKTTTKTAQSLVKDMSQEEVNEILQTLNVYKETIVKLKKDVPERLKSVKTILPNVESLENGLTDLNVWLEKGENLLDSHQLEGEAQSADERLEKHKAFFAETTYQKSILESKSKVYQKVLNSKTKLPNVDFSVLESDMDSVQSRFQSTSYSAKAWEQKLDSLQRLWRLVLQKARLLDDWLEQADNVLRDREDDVASSLKKHKLFFERANPRLLPDYLQAAEELRQKLGDENTKYLDHMIDSRQQNWKLIHHHAPIHRTKLEFCLQENKFLQEVESGERTLLEHQKQLRCQENIKDVLKQHKQIFHQGPFISTCQSHLAQMKDCVESLDQLDPDDCTLEDRHDNHWKRWRALLAALDDTHLQLKQLPERWKEYNNKFGEFKNWVAEAERLSKALQDESLTGEEYRTALEQYQETMKKLRQFAEDSAWLEGNLSELLQDAPDADSEREREKLRALLERFQNLKPSLKEAGNKSHLFSQCYEFRDTVGNRTSWLDEYQRQVLEQPYVDGLDEARSFLQDHEQIVRKLESEKASVEEDIEKGERLTRDRDAPAFVSKATNDLSIKWKDTNTLAKAKHEKLKQTVHNWEQYEAERSVLLQNLKKAEEELERTPSVTGHENAQKDLQTKKEMQHTLGKLKSSLSEMQKLNAVLAEGASRERQGPLKGEMSDIDKKLENISVRLNAKLADLEATIARWSEYYKRLNNFCDWLNEKEEKLTDANDADGTPEIQYEQTQEICTDVFENHITLENLEKDARGLSKNFRSRETSALKSKLTSVRRQWETLCSRAKDRSSSLSDSVTHWHVYQNLAQQLMPWISKAEQYCCTELPKCATAEEARKLHDIHQSFLHECEEQFPTFEKMNTEAGYLLDQPAVADQLADIRQRWDKIISTTEDRSHKVDKMYGAWNAYENERGNFEEVLEKLNTRLHNEPNVVSTDVQVLQNEVAMCKALQEEVRSHQPKLTALQRQMEQLKPYLNPEGLENVQQTQAAIDNSWENVNSSVAERQTVLSGALQHRREFYGRLQDFEKWVKKTQRKLDAGNEIYTDEVADTQNKLQGIKKECNEKENYFESLQAEFKDLIQECNEDEAGILSDRFDRLMAGYTKIEDLVENRQELCAKMSVYNDSQKEAQTKLNQLQSRLKSGDLSQEEVSALKLELAALKDNMGSWVESSEVLDELLGAAEMVVKDRASQRTLHFGAEVQGMENLCEQVAFNTQQKQEQLDALSQQWVDFLNQSQKLTEKVNDVKGQGQSVEVVKSDLQGLKDAVRNIEDLKDDVSSYNPEYEQLRQLGRQMIRADSSRAPEVQAMLARLANDWESAQVTLSDKQEQYAGVVSLWQQYNDNKQGVSQVLEEVEPVLKQDTLFDNQGEVKKALDQHKTAEFELSTNQGQLEQMNLRGVQLLEKLKSVPGFDWGVFEDDLDNVNHHWETANESVESKRDNLEAQLTCWDQLQSASEEAGSWVNTMVTKLEDTLNNFDDAVNVETRLQKFKEELPHFTEALKEIDDKVLHLQQLNRDHEIPALLQEREEIQEQFVKANKLANQLEDVLESYSDERLVLQKQIDTETKWLNGVKEALAKQDDVSGSDDDLMKRLYACKDIRDDLEAHKKQIEALQEKTGQLQMKYPSAETANLVRDAIILNKKFAAVLTRSDKVEEMLEDTVEQHCMEAQSDQERWIEKAKEKVVWCQDIGDRYGAEAKLATIQELEASFEMVEQQRELTAAKTSMLMSALPQQKQAMIETKHSNSASEWQSLVQNLGVTKSKLETSLDQWKVYDNKYDNVSSWLKQAEAKLRTLSTLKPDLASKEEQLQLIKELEADILLHCDSVDDIRGNAGEIAKSTGDGRTASYATQLANRYQTLMESLKDQSDKKEAGVENHEIYLSNQQVCRDWLDQAQQQLKECSKTPTDEQSLNQQLALIKSLISGKNAGLNKLNAAIESGEKLFPSTSNEGRETIRQELRSLKELWEDFNDQLNDSQRRLESSQSQWSSFDEKFDEVRSWVEETATQLETSKQLKDTLPEKKASLQKYKTISQDIQSHEKAVESLSDKGRELSSSSVTNKVDNLNKEYRALATNAQKCLLNSEEVVNQHQMYEDFLHSCQDWLTNIKDKLSVCAEATGDKHTLQNRVDRLKDLSLSMRQGQAKLKNVTMNGEKTIPQTGAPGQEIIEKELSALVSEWDQITEKLSETQQSLDNSLTALESYDNSCGILGKWLKTMEAKVKDVELQSTVKEKQTQLEKLQDLETEINSKESDFFEVVETASHIHVSDPKTVNISSQLMSRCQNLQTNLKSVLEKWTSSVTDHRDYQQVLAECQQWIEGLHQRIQVCSDMSGDQHDLEDKLQKLMELSQEKEAGSSRVSCVVEAGEKLYPNTASEGRDTIRQELRLLRERWDLLGDDLDESQRKLETCLTQWSSYQDKSEQMERWLLEAQLRLNEDSDLKATLPEKKTQLQNQKSLHQDIVSRQHWVDSLSERAQVLSSSTPSGKVTKFTSDLQEKYNKLCSSSQEAVVRYEAGSRDHQMYQDAYQDALDWLHLSQERVRACTETPGDKLSLNSKLERLKDYCNNMHEGEAKVVQVTELAGRLLNTTSRSGQEVIQREVNQLESEWSDYVNSLNSSQKTLDATKDKWSEFDSRFESVSSWLKNLEGQIKSHELKATLSEKEAQVEKFKKMRSEVSSRQFDIDGLNDDAQALTISSSDLRLTSHVTQLTNRYQALLQALKGVFLKWDGYVCDHVTYNGQQEEFSRWFTGCEEKLTGYADTTVDKQGALKKQQHIQELLSEKENGLKKLNSMVESGEKLLPDTAASGREIIRQEMRKAKDSWDSLFANVNDSKRQVEAFLSQWSSYSDGQEQLTKWISATEALIQNDIELKNTLQEKKTQLQEFKTQLQDIQSHQRLVDSVLERAESLVKATPNSDVAATITDLATRYEKMTSTSKSMIQTCEQRVTDHQHYQESYQLAQEWLVRIKDRLSMCDDPSGDKHTLQNKRDRLQDLISAMSEGEQKIAMCESNGSDILPTTDPRGKQTIHQEVDGLKSDLSETQTRIGAIKSRLDRSLHHWTTYDEQYDKLLHWLKDQEKVVKDFPLVSTLKLKEEQLNKYQGTLQEVSSKQKEFDNISDEAQTVQQLTGENRVVSHVTQLTSRFQSLFTTSKDILKKCEQNVGDHKEYEKKHENCRDWLLQAKERYEENAEVGGTKAIVEQRLVNLQAILAERDEGLSKLNQAVEASEMLYPNTATDGREAVRQDIRGLKQIWESLFDDLTKTQRQQEAALVQWTSFDDSHQQVALWLKEMEGKLDGPIPLKNTLEEKRSQAHHFKSMLQDVISYQRIVDSITDKAQTLVSASRDPELTQFIQTTNTRYQKLLTSAKTNGQTYDGYVTDHQQYNDAYNDTVDWLNGIREKLSMCSDLSGDYNAIHGRLDKIQDIDREKREGEPKVETVLRLAEKVLPNTAPQGKDTVIKEMEALRADWDAFGSALIKTEEDLKMCLSDWSKFDALYQKCSKWLRDLEAKVKEVELQPSLSEKQNQLSGIEGLMEKISSGESDLEELRDIGQSLSVSSSDSRVVSQASQLTTRHQTLSVMTKEIHRRWEQYVSDHEAYEKSRLDCSSWLEDLKARLADIMIPSSDWNSIETQKTRLLDLMKEKDQGLPKLRVALDNMQIIMPNTSVSGRDVVRREMQELHQDYDNLSADLNQARGKLEGYLSQFTQYTEGCNQVQDWINDVKNQLLTESELQATLEEKKMQLDRVKVLQLNAASQKSSVDNLSVKAESLKDVTQNPTLEKTTSIARDYETLLSTAQKLLDDRTTHVQHHQIYRDKFLEASDWLTDAMEKLTSCSDMRGDCQTVESQRTKAEELAETVGSGKDKLKDAIQCADTIVSETSVQGHSLVQEELGMLGMDFQNFEREVEELQSTLEQLSEQWMKYEESYKELSDWFKNTDLAMKEFSGPQTTLEDKKAQLQKQKACHESILEQQVKFDELTEKAQALLHTTTDSRLTSQLTQLSSRYTVTMATSKDLLKRYEQHVQDHTQYNETLGEALSWLETTEDKLSLCRNTSGDKYLLQTQLEKLQEFVVLKDGGQLLIHAANTWAEKVLLNTSSEGKVLVKQEVEKLQQSWNSLMSDMTSTKVTLETCLMKWTDLDENRGQIQKWLKEMEKKVRATDAPNDLPEKRANHFRMNGIYQDIEAYEHMVKSAVSKVENLPSSDNKLAMDLSQLADRYYSLRDNAKELLDKGEQSVNQHQEYKEASNGFIIWLRAAREKLVTCSDTYGDKATIIAKIDKAKSLSQNLSEGTKKLMDCTVSGETTLPNTSPQGQSKIRQELSEMNRDFEEYKTQLTSSQSQLDSCLNKWNEFEDGFENFNEWIQETENHLQKDPELKATVEEKKDVFMKYQRYHDEVRARETVLDAVNEKAQALLQTNADAKLSHAITQLTTTYQGVLSNSKGTIKKLEGYHADHKEYKNGVEDFTEWLKEAKVKLEQINNTSGSKNDVTGRLERIRDIQSVLDQGQSKLRSLTDIADKTTSNTSEAGCKIIKQEMDVLKSEYDKLKSETTTARQGLEEALSHWGDFDRVYDQLHDWMTDTETKVKSQPDLKADLPEKKSCLERLRAIVADVEAHHNLLEKLEERSSQLKDPSAVTALTELRQRYETLLSDGKDGVKKLEEEVACHEEYRKAYNESVDWLSEAKRKLQRLNDTSGDCQSLEQRLQALQEFHADMKKGEELINRTTELGDKLRLSTAPKGQNLIGQEIQTLKDDWHTFNVALGEVESNLETGVSEWKQYDIEYNDLQLWLERSDEKVKAMLMPQSDLSQKQQILASGQSLYEEIVGKKSALDSLREEADAVSHRSSDPRVSTNVMQMSSKYQMLTSAAKSMVHRLKENASDHESYNNSYDDCLQWLDMTHGRLKECGHSSSDWQALPEKMNLIQAITSSMEEGLEKVNKCCDLAEKILPHTGTDGKKSIEEEITKLTQDWEDMNKEINDCSGTLEGAQSKWHEYEKYHGSFIKWMTEVEGVIALHPEPKAQLVEKKTQLDKYKLILSDVENHEQLLNELSESVSNLESMGDNPEVADSLLELQNRYDRLRSNAQERVNDLEEGYAEHLDYQEAQQDCEKWLLQTSFRLMSHNALNVSTLELTGKQIEKHRSLLKEIEDYRGNIEHVTNKGRDLLENHPNVPELHQQVDGEIKNLEESYMNLQATAIQIKNRLGDVEKKWTEYQSLLTQTDHYLSDEFSDWLEAANTDIPDDLTEAGRQLEATKSMHEKLCGIKQELSNAAQRCETLSGTDTTEQLPSDEESAINILATQVNEEMDDAIQQAESRISKLRDVINQWEGVERQRTDLRNWLHFKQEEVQNLEEKSNKLHPEAAELEISNLQALREEIVSKGPMVEGFVDRYRMLTQHKPSLADPVVRALKDDWEELVGQVDNLIMEKELSLQHAQDYHSRHNDTEEDLDRLARELERIDRMEATMEEKGLQAQPPRRRILKSRGTQTGSPVPRRHRGHGDSDNDSDGGAGGGFDNFPRPSSRQSQGASRLSRGNVEQRHDSRYLSPPYHNPRRRPSSQSGGFSVKKLGTDGEVVSDTDESGYGETCTQHASSFDYSQEDLLSAMSFTPRGAASAAHTAYDSDEDNVSVYSDYGSPLDPEDLRDIGTQTPGYAQTQTPATFMNPTISVEEVAAFRQHLAATQAAENQTASTSGTQTKKKKKKRLRSDMLKGILAEVKSIKAEKGLDSSVSEMETDAMSDVSSLRSTPSRTEATSVSTPGKKKRSDSRKSLFSSGDYPSSTNEPKTAATTSQSPNAAMQGSMSPAPRPLSASARPAHPTGFSSPPPMFQERQSAATQDPGFQTQPNLMSTYPLPSRNGSRTIGSQDLQAVQNRLEALRNYQIPSRSCQPSVPVTPSPTVPQGFMASQVGMPMWTPMVPAYLVQPPPAKITRRKAKPRYRVRDFTRSYDDIDLILSDSDGGHRSRRRDRRFSRVIDNYHLDDALFEAAVASRQLKKLSQKMKNSLRDEILKG